MPGVIGRLFPAEAPAVFAYDNPILANDDPIGIGLDFDRTANGARLDRVLLLSNRTRQVFDTEALTAWKPSKRPRSGTSVGRSSSKTSQIVRPAHSGWRCALA